MNLSGQPASDLPGGRDPVKGERPQRATRRHGAAPGRVRADNAEQRYRDVRMSVYRSAWLPIPAGTVSVDDLIRMLRNAPAARIRLIDAIRDDARALLRLQAAGAGPKDPRVRELKKHRDEKKGRLGAVTIGAVFHQRRALEESYTPTGLTVVDIDKVEPETAARLRDEGRQLPGCLTAFISPSGRGVKYIVKLTPTPRGPVEHDAATHQVMHAFAALLKRKVDPSGCDVSRLCYLSADPQTASWDDNGAFEWSPNENPAPPAQSAPRKTATKPRRHRYADAGRNNELYVACMQSKRVQQLLQAIARAGELGLDDAEIWRTVRSALKRRVKEMARAKESTR